MTTPLATIADALIEFILSLLRDPDAAEAFEQDPDASLARARLGDVCADDVRSVLPVVVDRPEVVSVSPPDITVNHPVIVRPHPEGPRHDLIREIKNVVNNFNIDNRATILDQSVNQSIWAEGDVTQLFDQEAVIAAGDHSVAAGKDVGIDSSSTDIDAGDVAIGNTDVDVEIDDSFKDQSTNVELEIEADVEDSLNDASSTVDTDVHVEDSFNDTTGTTTEQTVTVASAAASEPAGSTGYAQEPVEETMSETVDYTDDMLVEEPPFEADFDDQG